MLGAFSRVDALAARLAKVGVVFGADRS
jgi:hypothetical protein